MEHAALRFLIELENRKKQLARDTDINNCRANRRERLFYERKIAVIRGRTAAAFTPLARDAHITIFVFRTADARISVKNFS